MALQLVTLAEVNSYLGIPAPAVSASADARATIIGETAEAWAEAQLGCSFICESRVEEHSSDGLPYIEPYVLPIASITSVTDSFDSDEALDSTDYHQRGDFLWRSESGDPPYIWPGGFNRWKVTLVSGYNNGNGSAPTGSVAAPAGIKGVVLAVARRLWQTRGGILSESDGKMNVRWDNLSTGELARQLDPFRLKTGF